MENIRTLLGVSAALSAALHLVATPDTQKEDPSRLQDIFSDVFGYRGISYSFADETHILTPYLAPTPTMTPLTSEIARKKRAEEKRQRRQRRNLERGAP